MQLAAAILSTIALLLSVLNAIEIFRSDKDRDHLHEALKAVVDGWEDTHHFTGNLAPKAIVQHDAMVDAQELIYPEPRKEV